ncbi:aromatase/cyclase [Streptomyces sclerotialus]|uniref:aromatase/cyclase n=1 Tax=Streptomyces sclerotialus TaxID=1957 RepID=UPI0004C52453
MSESTQREVEHDIHISAPAAAVYRLLSEVENWPRIFPPTLYVDHLAKGDRQERIRIWATANGEAKNWTSRRTLDPEHFRITFRQEVSAPPVASMGGMWVIEPVSDGESRVRLLHFYRATDDDPQGLAWIDEAVDRNSRSELAALKSNVEFVHNAEALTFSFEDTLRINGSGKDVYDFLNEAHLWSERLPHVAKVHLKEDVPGLQLLEMETRAKDGSTHTTTSYRVTFPYHRIVYKQVTLPALMTLHTGCWEIRETPDGVTTSSQHTVMLNADNIERVLGAGATVDDARDYVRNALSTNSRATLGHAKEYAESRR